MGGFVGIINLKENVKSEKENIIKMSNVLEKVGPDESGYFFNEHAIIAHKRLTIVDSEGRQTTNDIYG